VKNIALQPIEINAFFIFKNIEFEYNSAVLPEMASIELDKLVALLKENNSIKVQISGHTDNTGKPESNKVLSEKRATAVKDYLVKKGVAADRLTTIGFGQEQPVDDNATSTGKAKNRRVEFKVSQ